MKGGLSLPIRWRIQAWYGALLALVVAALLAGFYRYERQVRFQNLEHQLSGPLIALLPRVLPGPEGRRPPPRPEEGGFEEDLELDGYYYAAWDRDGRLRQQSPTAPHTFPPLPRWDGDPRSESRWNGENFELIQVTPMNEVIVLGISGRQIESELHYFALKLTAVGVGVMAVSLAGGWWVTRRALRPIGDIAHAAERIAAGDRSQKIVLRNTQDELGRLAAVLNEMLDQLSRSYDLQVRFTSDASHELRTPVAVILAQTQLALSRARTAEEYQEALGTCQRAAERMRKILGDLLSLARFDAGEEELNFVDCDLGEVVREALDFVAPLAAERQIPITESLLPLRGNFAPSGLSHVLINLLTNAMNHNPDGCTIAVAMRREENLACVSITDSGRGIPTEALSHIFERFYREDKARSAGGSGLGLAIAQRIVVAHGGTITAESTPGQGARFELRMPATSGRRSGSGNEKASSGLPSPGGAGPRPDCR